MDIDDQWNRNLEEEPHARRLPLVRGGAHGATPYQAPKLELITNAERGLFDAVLMNDVRGVSAWLARGADANARDRKGRTALFEAVRWWKDPAIAEALIERGADVRARDEAGRTPLHAAAARGRYPHVRVLLGAGAEIDARDQFGKTPLHWAAGGGALKATMSLVSQGADVSIRDIMGRTPLTCVLMNFPEGIMREPLEQLLGGFMTARIVEVRPDSLIVEVESVHSRYPVALRQARERGTLAVPCGLFPEVPQPGDVIRCRKGLSQGLDDAWQQARRRELGIEPER